MSPWAGPSVLRPEHLRAMERALERELPGFAERKRAAMAQSPTEAAEPTAVESVPEPLPIWTPPTFEPPAEPGPCPNCGEQLAISRIDLTANASWLQCRACNRRWGGAIERERGRAANS